MGSAWAAAPAPGPPLEIRRATGPITIDGDLSDPGWQGADSVATWFETFATDNTEPQVGNVAWLAYDDRYLYAGFRFSDPHPERIRAPLMDHDALTETTDYGGMIVNSRNDGKTGYMFLASPSGVTYDGIISDVTGEDASPDYYWAAAGRITPTGWNLEIRVPFSSLRYSREAQPVWSIMLYRNFPRDRDYHFNNVRLPKDVNCFVCNSSTLTGLSGLPRGSHLVVAPFTTSQRVDSPSGDLGTPLQASRPRSEGGADVKWNPLADLSIDGTVHPDFSQVEADAAQIGANERFALFYPEKRSFFLEGVDLLSTPFQAVYTRTITSPDAGLRATGRWRGTSFTALVTRDRGGGSVILPGPLGSSSAPQDFGSEVGIARLRHDMGPSFIGMLVTDREVEGGGHNHVLGPDFQWRPRSTEAVTGQLLWSHSRTPVRPALASEWDGRALADHAGLLHWTHRTRSVDWTLQGKDLGGDFRADDGFIPQVGYREWSANAGYTVRPKTGFFSRLRMFTADWTDLAEAGGSLGGRASVGAAMDGRWSTLLGIELDRDVFRVGGVLLRRDRPRLSLQASPSLLVNLVSLDLAAGDEIDFVNARRGKGVNASTSVTLRPGGHLELQNDASGRWLNVDAGGRSGRLFSAAVERARVTYSFSARSFVRVIGQYATTRRDTSLYTVPVAPHEASLSASALFAYKLNWQTVAFVGYGDDRTFADLMGRLEPSGRQAFAKLSYAWQR